MRYEREKTFEESLFPLALSLFQTFLGSDFEIGATRQFQNREHEVDLQMKNSHASLFEDAQ